MAEFLARLSKLSKRRSIKYAIPFLGLIVGSSFGLREFASLKYQFSTKRLLTEEQAEKEGIVMKKLGEVTLESEYEKIKSLDIDNWENKRGPRPWEENVNT